MLQEVPQKYFYPQKDGSYQGQLPPEFPPRYIGCTLKIRNSPSVLLFCEPDQDGYNTPHTAGIQMAEKEPS
jgi:hypothetical protein